MMRLTLQVGKRVFLATQVDLEPMATLMANERGTVRDAYYDEEGNLYAVEIEMDNFHYGLSLWSNVALLSHDALAAVRPMPVVKFMLDVAPALGSVA